ncbi:MAG: TatD family nuclease-associated radical SAM protein [Candidatus Saganbacteria bacterium]|nr:TatD family nuclease-associated radical SAM protein [Candidatus Saganbacteria bacterium]
MSDAIAYQLGDSLYLNITNRCTNQCTFCIRYKTRTFHGKYPLWLNREPAAKEILEAIGDPSKYKQIVFCGYGEPLIRLETIKEVAKDLKSKIQNLKSKQGVIIRIDTNGEANLFYQRNILPELKGLIDSISISLNAENAEVYDSSCRSIYGKKAFDAIIEFIKESKKYIPKVEITVVDIPGIDKKACEKIAKDLGVKFRVRSYYEEKYVR